MRQALLALALLALGQGAAGAAEPVAIRLSWINVPTSLGPILFAHPGLARHQGASYTLEPVHFVGSTPMITALGAGDLDIAELSFSSFAFAIENAQMDDLRVIADDFQDAIDGYYATEFMVLKDGPIRRIEDLKGKVVATNVIGAGLDIGVRAMLRRHGLEDKRDYTVIEANYATMRALLADRKADLVPAPVTFAHDPALRAIGRTLFTQRDAFGPTQILAWCARAGFIAAHRAALVDFMEDVLRANRWYHDPANRAEVLAIAARASKRPEAAFAGWLFTHEDEYRDPDGLPNLAAMQHNIDQQRAQGFLAGAVDVRAHADLSLVTEARARLR